MYTAIYTITTMYPANHILQIPSHLGKETSRLNQVNRQFLEFSLSGFLTQQFVVSFVPPRLQFKSPFFQFLLFFFFSFFSAFFNCNTDCKPSSFLHKRVPYINGELVFVSFEQLLTYHDYQNSNKNCSKISEKEESMFHVVPIPKVGSLYYLLGVHYHVAHKHHKSKIQLQKQYGSFRDGNPFISLTAGRTNIRFKQTC